MARVAGAGPRRATFWAGVSLVVVAGATTLAVKLGPKAAPPRATNPPVPIARARAAYVTDNGSDTITVLDRDGQDRPAFTHLVADPAELSLGCFGIRFVIEPEDTAAPRVIADGPDERDDGACPVVLDAGGDRLSVEHIGRDPVVVAFAATDGRDERDLVTVGHLGIRSHVFQIARRRDAVGVRLEGLVPAGKLAPHCSHRRRRVDLEHHLVRSRDLAQAREQPHRHPHARLSASARACSSSGFAVAPSIQDSPPSKCSCFQMGTICLTRSMA